MHNIPESNQEEHSRAQARAEPEDLDFELLNLPFATAKRLERFQSQSKFAYTKIEQKLEQRYHEFADSHPDIIWKRYDWKMVVSPRKVLILMTHIIYDMICFIKITL